jgi:glycosyltransferase involved in cell wall biosynthesis
MNKKIAILLPVFNKEMTLAKVINDFKQELPIEPFLIILAAPIITEILNKGLLKK